MGTPNEEVWPGVSKLVNWHEYPQWSPKPLSSAVPGLDEAGRSLLSVSIAYTFLACLTDIHYLTSRKISILQEMLHYEPSKRISAKKAMEHSYFDDLDKSNL